MYATEDRRYDDGGDMWSVASRRLQSDLSDYPQRGVDQYSDHPQRSVDQYSDQRGVDQYSEQRGANQYSEQRGANQYSEQRGVDQYGESQREDTAAYGFQQHSRTQQVRGSRYRQEAVSASNIWDDYAEVPSTDRGAYQSNNNNYEMVSQPASARPIESIQSLRVRQPESRQALHSRHEQEGYGSMRQTSSNGQNWDDSYSTPQPLMDRETDNWLYCHACDMSFSQKLQYLSHCQERLHKDMVARKLGGSGRLTQSKASGSVGYAQVSRQTEDNWTTDVGSSYARMSDADVSARSRQRGGQVASWQSQQNIEDRAQRNDDWYSSVAESYGREREGRSGNGVARMSSGGGREMGNQRSGGMGGIGDSARGIMGASPYYSDDRRDANYYTEVEGRGQVVSRGNSARGMVGSASGGMADISGIDHADNSYSGSMASRYGVSSPAVHAPERRMTTQMGQMSSTPFRAGTTRVPNLMGKNAQNRKRTYAGAGMNPASRPGVKSADIRISKEQVANALKKIKIKSSPEQLNECKVCGIGGSSGTSINEFHWKGKKHFHTCFKEMLLLGPKQFFEKYGKLPATPHASFGIMKAAATQRNPYKSFMYRSGVMNAFRCKVCSTQLNSLDLWVKHVTSNEHKVNCNQLLQKDGLELFLNDFPTTPAPFLTDDETVKTLPGYVDLESRFPYGDDKSVGVKQPGSADKSGHGSTKQPPARLQGAGERRNEDNRTTEPTKRPVGPGPQGMRKKANAPAMRAPNAKQPLKRGLEMHDSYGMPKTRRIEGQPGNGPTAAQTVQRRTMAGRPQMRAAPVQPLFPDERLQMSVNMRRQQMAAAMVPQLLEERTPQFIEEIHQPMPQRTIVQQAMPQRPQAPTSQRDIAMQLQQLTGVTDSQTVLEAVNILSTVNLESLQGMSNASLDVLQRMIPMVQQLGNLAGMDSQPLIDQLSRSLMQGQLNPNDLLQLLQQANLVGGGGAPRSLVGGGGAPRPQPQPLIRPAGVRMRGMRPKGRGRARP